MRRVARVRQRQLITCFSSFPHFFCFWFPCRTGVKLTSQLFSSRKIFYGIVVRFLGDRYKQRFALCYGPLSVLSVCNVGVLLWANGRMHQDAT